MKQFARWSGAAVAIATLLISEPAPAVQGCAARRMTAVGPICVDRYEASVWRIPPTETALIKAAQTGKPTAAELAAGGALRLGVPEDFPPCEPDGAGCDDVYAVSTAGVVPTANVTWFQAQQACLNARKRLARNAEWQAAADAAPDTGSDDGATDCNTSTAGGPVQTGSRSACASRFGNLDMVGNLYEWTADWVPASAERTCPGWELSNDDMCFAGASTTNPGPGVPLRGGFYDSAGGAGPLTVNATADGAFSSRIIGFRCAR